MHTVTLGVIAAICSLVDSGATLSSPKDNPDAQDGSSYAYLPSGVVFGGMLSIFVPNRFSIASNICGSLYLTKHTISMRPDWVGCQRQQRLPDRAATTVKKLRVCATPATVLALVVPHLFFHS